MTNQATRRNDRTEAKTVERRTAPVPPFHIARTPPAADEGNGGIGYPDGRHVPGAGAYRRWARICKPGLILKYLWRTRNP